MFLHAGIGAHRHEYSQEQHANTNSVRSQLARSMFSTSINRRNSAHESQLRNPSMIPRRNSNYIPSTQPVVRFQEREGVSENEDSKSVASEGSGTTAGGSKRRRRTTRTSTTTFHIAHPAPTVSQRQKLLLIRPKILLQLQRLSASSRPKPAIDVLPSTVIVPRLVKKFPRLLRGKSELGAHDVLIVKSEDYDATTQEEIGDSDSDEEGLGSRELIAVICQMPNRVIGPQDKAEIAMIDGSVWVARTLPGRQYEFSTTDERGHITTARWVRRRELRNTSVDNVNHDGRFTFSIIDPNSRRHPILGTLTPMKLDIPDHYTTISLSAGKYPPTSPFRGLPGEPEYMSANEEPAPERTTHQIDDYTKSLIQVTGIWVALRENWSPYFKYKDSAGVGTSTHIASAGRARSTSLTLPVPPMIGTETPDLSHGARGVYSCKINRGSVKVPHASENSISQEIAATPQRSVSTGAAFMQRVTARKLSHPIAIAAVDSEGEETYSSTRRVSTANGNPWSRMSTPIAALTLESSVSSTHDTPTRPPRRSESMYVSRSTLQQNHITQESEASGDLTLVDIKAIYPEKKQKLSRWRMFTNIFRRAGNTPPA